MQNSTKIPLPEAHKNSPGLARRKRHLAGGVETSVCPPIIADIKDVKAGSRPVLSNKSSDMDCSSLGILSPSDMKTSWTNSMVRSRTFTRELNDPKAEHDLVIEDLESADDKKKSGSSSKKVKKFKLNTVQIEADPETSMLMSRTEELRKSVAIMPKTSTCPQAAQVLDCDSIPDVDLKSRTESLLYSKSTRKKKSKKKSSLENEESASGSASWSNIPKCLNVSVLSSDAGISSMPSSMISEHEENHIKAVLTKALNSGPTSLPTPDVLNGNNNKEVLVNSRILK